MQKVPWSTV